MGNRNGKGISGSTPRPRHIGLLFGLLAAVLTAFSAQACELPEIRTDERPNPDNTPISVKIAIGVADVLGVDDVNQQLQLDLFAQLQWQDSRLSGLAGCRFPVTSVWFPEIFILNSSRLTAERTNRRDEVAVGENGWVEYNNRLSGYVSSYHDLTRFPFDSHNFEIEIAVPSENAKDLVLVADSDGTWLASRLNVEGWTFHGVSLTSAPARVDVLNHEVSVATLTIEAERNSEYFVYRVLLLLAIVVAMSWVIFWVPPERFEFQLGLGATAMLTAIAFNFSVASNLPPVGYLTIMDRMVIWAVFIVSLAIVEALITARLLEHDRKDIALTVDRIARFAVPLVFAVGWWLIILNG